MGLSIGAAAAARTTSCTLICSPVALAVPTSIWIVLLLIAGVVFCYMLFFADSGEGAFTQAMLMGSTVTVVVATLLAINALNHPYNSPAGGIKPTAMERSLHVLDEARALVSTSPPPCDAKGAAVRA